MLQVTLTPPPALLAIPGLLQQTLPEVAEGIRNEIVSTAQRELGASGQDYAQGVTMLQYPVTTAKILRGGYVHVATISLTGWLPNAIENGLEPYDMKPALLQGRNAKIAKDGTRYNTVPFRHQTPGTVGVAGAPMGSAEKRQGMSKTEAELLGKKIHREARKLKASTSQPGKGTQWGERLAARVGGVKKLKPHHSTDIYAGMVRMEKTYREATQNQYRTFRRVSDRSPSAKWLHPGIQRRDFFGRAAKRVPAISGLIFNGAVAGVGKGGP